MIRSVNQGGSNGASLPTVSETSNSSHGLEVPTRLFQDSNKLRWVLLWLMASSQALTFQAKPCDL